eukprot:5146945-Alexandrium_andersonii.AAC.1
MNHPQGVVVVVVLSDATQPAGTSERGSAHFPCLPPAPPRTGRVKHGNVDNSLLGSGGGADQ